MDSRKMSDTVSLLGIDIDDLTHEFIISEKQEFLPIILFGLLATRGITKLFERN